jgi:hypothetical protein
MTKFMKDPKKQEFISPPGLAPRDRRVLHQIAERLDIASFSKGILQNKIKKNRRRKT